MRLQHAGALLPMWMVQGSMHAQQLRQHKADCPCRLSHEPRAVLMPQHTISAQHTAQHNALRITCFAANSVQQQQTQYSTAPHRSTTMRKQAALVRELTSSSSSSTAEGLPTALNSAGHSDASVFRDTDTTTSAGQAAHRQNTNVENRLTLLPSGEGPHLLGSNQYPPLRTCLRCRMHLRDPHIP